MAYWGPVDCKSTLEFWQSGIKSPRSLPNFFEWEQLVWLHATSNFAFTTFLYNSHAPLPLWQLPLSSAHSPQVLSSSGHTGFIVVFLILPLILSHPFSRDNFITGLKPHHHPLADLNRLSLLLTLSLPLIFLCLPHHFPFESSSPSPAFFLCWISFLIFIWLYGCGPESPFAYMQGTECAQLDFLYFFFSVQA